MLLFMKVYIWNQIANDQQALFSAWNATSCTAVEQAPVRKVAWANSAKIEETALTAHIQIMNCHSRFSRGFSPTSTSFLLTSVTYLCKNLGKSLISCFLWETSTLQVPSYLPKHWFSADFVTNSQITNHGILTT